MAGEEEGFPTGNPAGFIRGLIQEGEGPTAGLRIFRDAGGAIQDSRWFELYGQVNDTIARVPETLGLDPFAVPSPGEYEVWNLGSGNQYMTQVEVQIRDRDTGLWFTKPHTFVTDEPHTAADAEEDAFATYGDPDTENNYGETVMGALAVTFATTLPYSP